jgi:hypothetical protein
MLIDVPEVRAASIIRAMSQLRTRQYIPEDFELYTRRCENLKSHISFIDQALLIFLYLIIVIISGEEYKL